MSPPSLSAFKRETVLLGRAASRGGQAFNSRRGRGKIVSDYHDVYGRLSHVGPKAEQDLNIGDEG